MSGASKLSLVEGSFEELAAELAAYIDSIKGEGSTVAADISPLLADTEKTDEQTAPSTRTTDRDAVLKKLVTGSVVLNNAPEKELQAAYNLLIHLISQSEDPDTYLPHICRYLTSPITSSAHNGSGIALGVLGTLFNTVQPDDETRYHVLLAVIELIKQSENFETLKPQLRNVDDWIASWELEPSEARKLYLAIADAAVAAKQSEESYFFLLKSLRTLQDDATSAEARGLATRALKVAFQNEKHFDFQDLIALDAVQALRKTDQVWIELLEVFSAETYDDFQDFKETNSSFLSENTLDEALLDNKIRLLTLASLASQASQTRTLPYAAIAKALHVPTDDVELWVIDSIRRGLVEGKLSQQKQEFLIHRSTYRVFGENQWREVASRLETWRSSLHNVLAVIRAQKEEFARDKEAALAGQANNNSNEHGGYNHRGGNQGYNRNQRQRNAPPPQAVEVE